MGGVSNTAALGAVVGMTGVDVVRGETYLLRGVDWTVEADHRWVVLGPNGAGKTTLLALAAAQMHPTRGEVRLLGETLGAVDVFELRPRIGLTSAALAQRIAGSEKTGDIVVSAGYAVVGRWREQYDVHDLTRAAMLMEQWGVAPFANRAFGTLSEGERGAGQADARPQLEDVDRAEGLPQQPHLTAGRVHLRRRQLQQRRLPGTVRAQHHPPVVGLDGPVHAAEEVGLPPHDVDPGHPDDRPEGG